MTFRTRQTSRNVFLYGEGIKMSKENFKYSRPVTLLLLPLLIVMVPFATVAVMAFTGFEYVVNFCKEVSDVLSYVFFGRRK